MWFTEWLESGGPVLGDDNISNRADRIAWHREARFGMFIHYGIDCVAKTHYPGDAWQDHPVPAKDYHRYWLEFKLPQCDPDKWAKTCAEAGMKYLCIVAKHHSGLCMWDSAYTDYEPQSRAQYPVFAGVLESFARL